MPERHPHIPPELLGRGPRSPRNDGGGRGPDWAIVPAVQPGGWQWASILTVAVAAARASGYGILEWKVADRAAEAAWRGAHGEARGDSLRTLRTL